MQKRIQSYPPQYYFGRTVFPPVVLQDYTLGKIENPCLSACFGG